MSTLGAQLAKNPRQGIYLGLNCYKIRLSISSKAKGKAGGARIITHLIIEQHSIILLAIYDKSEQEAIPDKVLLELIKFIR